VGWAQIISGWVLSAGLIAVGIGFLIYPARALRNLATDDLSAEEETFQRRQAYRRLAAGVLMLVLALLLMGALVFLEAPAQKLADLIDAHPDAENRPPLTPEQEAFKRFYGWYWMVILLLLLLLVVLGAWDYLASRNFGSRSQRRIAQDRRDMISREVDRLRGD
jgi:MFS family permease